MKYFNKLKFSFPRIIAILALILMVTGSSWSQVSTKFTFSQSAGTYTPITGASVLSSSTSQDAATYPISGLSFPFNGNTLTQVVVGTDGYLALGVATFTNSTAPLSSTNAASGIIAALGMNLVSSTVSGAASTLSWVNDGTETVFQWQDFARSAQASTERFSFQVRINNSTGVINLVYGSFTVGTSTSLIPQVGLRGVTATDVFNRRLTTTFPDATPSWDDTGYGNSAAGTTNSYNVRFTSTSPSAFPTNGQTFTFTPATCSTASLPWTESFDGFARNQLPTCWGHVPGTKPFVAFQAADVTYNDPQSAPNYVAIQYGNTVASYLYTPAFNLTSGVSYDYSFYWAGDGLSGWTGDAVYNITPSSSGATVLGNFVASGTTTTSAYTKQTYTFVPASSGTYYFGVKVSSSSTPFYLGFDDFEVKLSPTCPTPTAVMVGSITNNSASVSFTSAGTNFIVEYGAPGFTPGTGGSAGTGGTIQTGSSSPIALSGLAANTSYDVYVRQVCTGPDYSPNSAKVTFKTLCSSIVSYPYTEGFNTAGSLPACWTVSEGAPGASYHWESVTADASHGAGSPAEGTAFMRMYYFLASTTYNPYYLNSPAFSLDNVAKQATFSIWMGAASGVDNLKFQVSTDGGTNWATLATYTQNPANNSSSAPWENKTVDLSAYVSQTVLLRLNATSNYGDGYCNIGFDNLMIADIPACATPTATAATSVTTSTAYANWTPTTGNFIIEYGPTVTFGTPGTGATAGNVNNFVVTATNVGTIQLTSLSPNTGYSYVVRQDCTGSSNGYSLNSNTITFTTLALPPANDDCAGALVIPPSGPFPYLTTVVDNTGATNTNDPTNTCQANANAGVWYSFTPSQSGSYTLSLCQSDAPLSTISDNVLSIFTSSNGCAGPFTELICDDDGCTNLAFQAYANTNLTASTTYYILAYGYGTNRGNIQLYVSGPPINDECAGSINLTPTSGVFTDPGPQSLFGSTESSDAASCGLSGSPQDIWYVLTSDNDGNMNEKLVLTVTPGNSTADLALALYGGTCGALVELNCVNAGGDGVPETITYTETGFRGNDLETRDNTVYYLRVIDFYGESSPFTISATGSALPVTLVSFDAKAASARSVVLNWTVVDELNITQYIIESSSDGKHWSPIGSVKAAQTPAYSFRDENPSQGINYYRLQMVEANGSAAHSPIRQVIFSADRQVMLAPNPTSGQIYITGLEKVTQSAQISIYNEFGLKVWSGKLSGTELATSGIDLVRLVPGTYVIRVITDGSSNLLRFVKQ